jgi:hypothetical protein
MTGQNSSGREKKRNNEHVYVVGRFYAEDSGIRGSHRNRFKSPVIVCYRTCMRLIVRKSPKWGVHMQRPLIEPRWNVIYGWGAVLLAVFILIQIIPSTMGSLSSDEYDVIEKSEAESSASRFIQESFGESIASAAAVHQTQRVFYGYLAKEKLIDAYEKQYGDDYPTDTYQVEVRSTTTADRFERVRFVHVHMKTGEVIAWNEVKAGPDRIEGDLPFSAA